MDNRLQELFNSYYNKTATAEQKAELMKFIGSASSDDLSELIQKNGEGLTNIENIIPAEKAEQMLQQIIGRKQATVRRLWVRYAAAAAIILAFGSYFAFFKTNEKPIVAKTNAVQNDVAPGKDGAVLTLANGKRIVLDSASNGKITDVAVKNGNEVSYENSATEKVEYNTMTTPRGRQFSLVLADGSKVWLNAESSITYPTAFTGKERKVQITGEAYFEVKHDATKPFVVTKGDAQVTVLGTHFNVNAYDDEASIKVTLLEGSVEVKSQQSKVKIKPGEQAAITTNGQLTTTKSVDLEQVMAWKNNLFVFTGDKIQTVMRQVARWYDVDVQYKGNVTNEDFVGMVSRLENVSQVLKIMETTKKVKFEIVGRTITVVSP